MNIHQEFRQISSKLIMISSSLQKFSRDISAHIKDSKGVQLAQLISNNLPASYKPLSQAISIQLLQSYQQQINMDSLKLSTLQQLKNTITICRQFMKFTQGIQKWQSWIKASNQAVAQINQIKEQVAQKTQEVRGCRHCSMKVLVKGKYSQYTPICQTCQQQVQKRLSLASMYIRSKYIVQKTGKQPVQFQRVQAKYGQQSYFRDIISAIDSVVSDQMNWQAVTSFFTFCLTPFLSYNQTVRDQLTQPTVYHGKQYGSDVMVTFIAYPSRGVYQSKITYNLCYSKGQWKWKSELPSGKSGKSIKSPEHQYYDTIKYFFSLLVQHIRLPDMKVPAADVPAAVSMRPRRRQD